MQRHLHLCLWLFAFVFVLIAVLAVPAQSASQLSELHPQVQFDEHDAPQAAAGVDCDAAVCSAAQWNIVVSTVFTADRLRAALPPTALTVPDGYHDATDTPPPRV